MLKLVDQFQFSVASIDTEVSYRYIIILSVVRADVSLLAIAPSAAVSEVRRIQNGEFRIVGSRVHWYVTVI